VLDVCKRLAVKLSIRVNEVIERLAFLPRSQVYVAPDGKLHAVGIESAEIIAAPRRVLSRFRSVNWNPASALQIKLRPTVVASDLAFALVRRQRETNLEFGRNFGRALHAEK